MLAQAEEHLREGFKWLGSLDHSVEYDRNAKLHTAGTSEWILQNDQYVRWIQADTKTALLWIYGRPGECNFWYLFGKEGTTERRENII